MEKQNKAYLSASIGNVLEFYDFALFGFYAPIISKLYFPADQAINSLLLSFTVFAVGFLCRPIGALIFGYISDRYGRTSGLSYSLLGIGGATLGIGLLPTFETWGLFAPLCLAGLRIIQGISIGGEYSNSLVFVTEHLKKYRSKFPAFTTGTVSAMGVLGWFVASLFCVFFRDEDLTLFSWRIPFLFGSLVAAIGFYIRLSTEDAFEVSQQQQLPLKAKITQILSYKKTTAKIFSIGALMGMLFYGQFIFNNSFLPKVTSFTPKESTQLISIGIFAYMLILPLVGWISDLTSYRKSIFLSALLSGILGPLIFYLQTRDSAAAIIASQVISATLLSMLMSPGTYVMSLSFPQSVRCLGVSLSYNMGATLLGGNIPTIYLLLYKYTEHVETMAFFFSLVALAIAFVLYYVDQEEKMPSSSLLKDLFLRTHQKKECRPAKPLAAHLFFQQSSSAYAPYRFHAYAGASTSNQKYNANLLI